MVRLMGIEPPLDKFKGTFARDQYLPYKHAPNKEVLNYSPTGEFNVTLKTNSVGLRDNEHSYEKPKNTFRILGLGDSFTYGSGVNFEETYLYLLEGMLNANREIIKKVEIIKAGQCAYFPRLERVLLERYGVKYAPDLILIQFFLNDIIESRCDNDAFVADESGYLTIRSTKRMNFIIKFLREHSHLYRLLSRACIGFLVDVRYPKKWEELCQDNGFHEINWQKVEEEYIKIINIADEIKAKVVLVYIPFPPPWGKKDFYPSERLSKFASKYDIGFIDVLPAMIKNEKEGQLYYLKDCHCTPRGYKIIAGEIYNYLIKNGLIK